MVPDTLLLSWNLVTSQFFLAIWPCATVASVITHFLLAILKTNCFGVIIQTPLILNF